MQYEITVTYRVEAQSVSAALDKSKLDIDTKEVLALNIEIVEAT